MQKQQNHGRQSQPPLSRQADAASGAIAPAHSAGGFPDGLESNVGGIRRCRLDGPAALEYMSRGLTDVTGYTADDMSDLFDNEFARIVYPDDRDAYRAFTERLAHDELVELLDYRIVRKDGSVVWVRDTMFSQRAEDGSMMGYSLLVDASLAHPAAPDGKDGDAVPVGVICFRQSDLRVVRTNEHIWTMLGVDEHDSATRGAIIDNAERLVPLIDQHEFTETLKKAAVGSPPVELDARLWHVNGYLVEVTGWLSLAPHDGEPLYQLAVVDVTRRRSRERAGRRRLRARYLETIYDVVFLLETSEGHALCLQYCGNELFSGTHELRIILADAVDYLVTNLAAPESQGELRKFLEPLVAPASGERPAGRAHRRFVFTARESQEGLSRNREAVVIDAESGGLFFCSRLIEGAEDAPGGGGRAAHAASFEDEGIVVTVSLPDGKRRIAYANAAARALFRLDEERAARIDGRELIARSSFPIGVVKQLERDGTADARDAHTGMPYRFHLDFDPKLSALRVLRVYPLKADPDDARAKATHAHGSGSVASALERACDAQEPAPLTDAGKRVAIRTFGYFDVFVDGQPIPFRSEKAKELLALLVDRRGGFVSSSEAISILWEDEPITNQTRTRYRKVAMRLKDALADHGISDIMETVRGKRRIVPENVSCDLLDYLANAPGAAAQFRGCYLQNYSWGEVTLSELLRTMPFRA